MKCIGEKCTSFYESDHRGWCLSEDCLKYPNDECMIEQKISIKKTVLRDLELLKEHIAENQKHTR